jgi:hypothetical protein
MSPERYPYNVDTGFLDQRRLDDYQRGGRPTSTHWCPYCGDYMPRGVQPETWRCCGEVGHAVDTEQDEAQRKQEREDE